MVFFSQIRLIEVFDITSEDAEKFTKIFNARVQPLFCSLNLLFSDVLVPVAIFLDSPLSLPERAWNCFPPFCAGPANHVEQSEPVRLLPLLKGEVSTQQCSV